jgi:hypothetical protein
VNTDVWRGMPFMRGQQGAERLVELRAIVQEQRQECLARRARVLRHKWARERLCQILGLPDAERWNGWVAPRRMPEDSCGKQEEHLPGGYRPNDAQSRRDLLDLLHDVERYESGASS